MQPLEWHTEKVKVSDLKGDSINPRKLTDMERRALEQSIKKFNLVEIPAVDFNNWIIAGHQRIVVLISLGRAEELIDVRKPNRPLTKQEKEEYMLRSNKTTGEWDLSLLVTNFSQDLLVDVGFTSADLQGLMKKVSAKLATNEDFDVAGMDLSGFESYNYVVLLFKEIHDWVIVNELLDLRKVEHGYYNSSRQYGVGRVIDGRNIIRRLQDSSHNSQPGPSESDKKS